jgi:hypothetical protein
MNIRCRTYALMEPRNLLQADTAPPPARQRENVPGVQPRVFQECLSLLANHRTYDFYFLASK